MAAAAMLFMLAAAFQPAASALSADGKALLSLLPAGAPSPVLPSWDPSSPTPCSWQGVTCSPQSRVVSLSLPNTFINLSTLPPQLATLSSLQLLNLSTCNISGEIPSSFSSSLSSLRVLDLSSNSLYGEIPSEIGQLSSLQYLLLNSNRLTGSIPRAIAGLVNLQVLCVQDNLLNGTIPSSLGTLASLQQFRVGGNPSLSGPIPPSLGALVNLTVFGAAATALSGEIPPEFGNLVSLQTLALYDTGVSGPIPAELGGCGELRNLYLHMNRLTGPIPPELGKLQKLTSLLLWGNALTGRIPPELSNCSSLVVLDLSGNRLAGEVPGELGRLAALEQLHLSDNQLTGRIPPEISNCSSLTALQLDKNGLAGGIPPQLGELKALQVLFLWGNSLSGEIPPELGNCTELYALDLSKNRLAGEIPDEVFALQKLSKLLLLGNSLSGKLPPSVAGCSSLVRLRLGENQLAGEIPREIGKLQNLVFLDLYSNKFTGVLPGELANITVLELLDVHNNSFTGNIPPQFGELMNLEQLDLSMNKLTGEIPASFGNFSYLNKLILSGNMLSGTLPKSIRNLQKLTMLELSNNSFSGPIPPEIGALSSLSISLDLSSNRFTGELPDEMSSLTQLQSLDLSSNGLYGSISVLSALTSLTSLNISYNNFSGAIPVTPFFKTLSSSSYIDNPNLCESYDGRTCSSDMVRRTALKTVKTVILVCAVLGSITLLLVVVWILVNRSRTLAGKKAMSLSVAGGDDFSHPWMFTPFQKLNFSVDNILECLIDENVIGKGCSGVVYRAEMPNGEIIAVKKLWKTSKEEPIDAFAAEIQILGHIRHRNIVKLLGYCSNKSVKLLLYNYIPNGNLQQLLKDNQSLDWDTRYKIAVGAAQGLAYLHHDCVPAILHRDVKCNNILLDSKYEAYLADFGLAKLMNSPNYHHAMSRIAGSYGYIAPGKSFLPLHVDYTEMLLLEMLSSKITMLMCSITQEIYLDIHMFLISEYGYTTKITEKSDVYSYGVVLLEILSGRSAVEPVVGDCLHIVEWAKKKMGSYEPAVNILDPKLRGMPDQLVQEMLQTLGIAIFCVNPAPTERPTMKEVVAFLKEVKCSPEEWGKISQQPLIKPGSQQG
uniref:non-specific serine/threonine protein kinase n=1 Tax=Leersia perrieri TaxID=77586 RepID=A0A0D9WRM8_9ORYZ